MILPDLLARLQSQAIDCVTLLLIDLREGALIESCGDVADAGTVTRVMRELVAPRHEETILLSDDFTYVCQRLADPPLKECLKCGGKLRKKVSAPAFQLVTRPSGSSM